MPTLEGVERLLEKKGQDAINDLIFSAHTSDHYDDILDDIQEMLNVSRNHARYIDENFQFYGK